MPGVRSVAFGAWVRAASLHEPRELMGVSHLLEHMVFKGTPRRSARQIALELEALGGSLDAYTSREHTVYQARVLDEHLEVAADVIGDFVFDPLLRRADLELEDLDLGVQVIESGYRFEGASYDVHDQSVALMLAGPRDRLQHVTHTIGGVDWIAVGSNADGRDLALRVSHGAGQTLLTFSSE